MTSYYAQAAESWNHLLGMAQPPLFPLFLFWGEHSGIGWYAGGMLYNFSTAMLQVVAVYWLAGRLYSDRLWQFGATLLAAVFFKTVEATPMLIKDQGYLAWAVISLAFLCVGFTGRAKYKYAYALAGFLAVASRREGWELLFCGMASSVGEFCLWRLGRCPGKTVLHGIGALLLFVFVTFGGYWLLRISGWQWELWPQ